MTATVETVSEQLDLAAIMPSEKVVSAIARSITLSDTDVGKSAEMNRSQEHSYRLKKKQIANSYGNGSDIKTIAHHRSRCGQN